MSVTFLEKFTSALLLFAAALNVFRKLTWANLPVIKHSFLQERRFKASSTSESGGTEMRGKQWAERQKDILVPS